MESVEIGVLITDISLLLVLAPRWFSELDDPHKCVILFQTRVIYADEFKQNSYPRST